MPGLACIRSSCSYTNIRGKQHEGLAIASYIQQWFYAGVKCSGDPWPGGTLLRPTVELQGGRKTKEKTNVIETEKLQKLVFPANKHCNNFH